MKLIDLLVRELHKRGGWPDGADWCVYHDIDEEVSFGYGLLPLLIDGTWTTLENDSHWLCRGDFHHQNSSDFNAAIVTRDQYESALAASQKAEWYGAGLPPVGCRIEYTCKQTDAGHPAIEAGKWYGGTIIAYYGEGVWTSDNGIRHLSNTIFRPIRSEADKKRDEAIEAIDWYMPEFIPDTPNEYYHAKKIYDAIAAGKIPGVKLED